MGIQINGATDTISASDGSLSVSSSESTFSGIATFTSGLNVTGGNVTGDLTGNVTGNINSSGVSTVTTLNATTISGVSTIGVTTATVTTLTVNGNAYPSDGPLSNRNIIINGAMQVAQRGTVVNAGSEYAGPDRFRFTKNDGAFTVSQDTDVPSGQGFANSWKCDVTTVAGTAGNFYVFLKYRIEGQDLQKLKKGTSSAESLTLQFWIKSPKAGTHIAELYDTDNDRNISKSYTVNDADTWEFKTLTFPGDTTGILDNDNSNSFEINLWLFAGTGFSSGTLNTSWNTNTDANRAVGQVNTADNTANNIYFTGIQLEVGSVATPFEHRSYGDELARCQRYFNRLTNGDQFSGRMNGTNNMDLGYSYPVTMRVSPSASTSFDTADAEYGSTGLTVNAISVMGSGPNSCTMRFGTSNSGTNGSGAWARLTGNSTISLSAEL